MYQIWCEWEFGEKDKLFTTKEAAMSWAQQCWDDWMEVDVGMTLQETLDEHLIGFEYLEVVA